MGCSVKFWDLDYALKCVYGLEATVEKLRKAELVRAIGKLTWFIRGLPQGFPWPARGGALPGWTSPGWAGQAWGR